MLLTLSDQLKYSENKKLHDMKRIKLLLFAAGITMGLLASGQVPQLIDYQGMARDGAGNPIANTVISLRLSVWEGPLPGTMAYQEIHHPLTNSYGLFHLMIGDGTVTTGNFATIPWAHGDFWVQTEIDPNGGTSFVDMGMSKLATVPFAFYAANAGGGGGSSPWAYNGPNIYFNTGWVAIGHDNPTQVLHVFEPGTEAHLLLEGGSGNAYFYGDAPTNSGLCFLEGGMEMGWLYWNAYSQAVFMYENGNQTQSWKGNRTGIGTLDPLVKVHVIEENSAGADGTDLNITYSQGQLLSPAVLGWAENNTSDISQGVLGHSYSYTSTHNEGVFGEGGGGTNNNYGTYGVAYGESGSNYSIAVYAHDQGSATYNYAAYLSGDVDVTGTLSKGGGSFKIDHPLDPANKYLYHSFVESPDMMNIYNGNITTGANGMAVVDLPSYFDALNMDFRYQLTVIGEFAQAIVKEEISGNQFTIQTDKPHVKVSWQVTGVRNDAWAQANRIQVEVNKGPIEKGLYLHPELHGKSADMGLKTSVPHAKKGTYKGALEQEKDLRTEPY
jgi:hypothetical protein